MCVFLKTDMDMAQYVICAFRVYSAIKLTCHP